MTREPIVADDGAPIVLDADALPLVRALQAAEDAISLRDAAQTPA